MTEATDVQIGKDVWKVLRRGSRICIVDGQGRERHRSEGHGNTAVHLAMQLARHTLETCPDLDESLHQAAQRFEAGLREPQPAPVPNERPAVWDLIFADMRQRDTFGAEKYKTRLQPHNGRDYL